MPVSLGYVPEGELFIEPKKQGDEICKMPYEYNSTNFIGYGVDGQGIFRAPDNCGGELFEVSNGVIKGYLGYIYENDPTRPVYKAPSRNDEFAGVFMTTANGPGPTFLARTGTLNGKPTYEAPGGLKVEFYDAGMGGQWFYYGGPPEDAEHANSEPGDEPYPWLASWRYGATATRQELPLVDPYAGVPYPSDRVTLEPEAQASADALVELTNETGEKARMNMAEGILTRYLEGVAMGTFLFESAVTQKLFDINTQQMSENVSNMSSYQPVPLVPTYLPKIAKLSFLSDTTSDPIGDEYRAKQKFVNMYITPLRLIAGNNLEGLGSGFTLGGRGGFQWDSTITLKSSEQEERLFDLVRQASTDSSFGAEVVVSYPPANQNPKNQIENNIIQAIQSSDSFIAKNVGLINSAS
jgi:hypothetical protein